MIYAGHKRLSTTQLYVHLSGADIDEKLLKIHGIKQENESTINITPVKCLRCSITNDPNVKYCKSCGMILDTKEAFDMKDTTEKDFQNFMMEAFKTWKTNNELWKK